MELTVSLRDPRPCGPKNVDPGMVRIGFSRALHPELTRGHEDALLPVF